MHLIVEHYLVGGLDHEFYFSFQLGIIIPTNEPIFFQRGRLNHQPVMHQTRNLDWIQHL